MNKEELAVRYSNSAVEGKGQYRNYDFDVRKELTSFDGYELEQAYEDGFDKAIEMFNKWVDEHCVHYTGNVMGQIPLGNIDEMIKDFYKSIKE